MQKDWTAEILTTLEVGSIEYSEFISRFESESQQEVIAALKSLKRCGFVRVYFEPGTYISITPVGSEELLKIKRYLAEKQDAKRKERAGWVQWIGSNAIALIALNISAIALAAQLGILPLPSLK